jgi:hypothetical protein
MVLHPLTLISTALVILRVLGRPGIWISCNVWYVTVTFDAVVLSGAVTVAAVTVSGDALHVAGIDE